MKRRNLVISIAIYSLVTATSTSGYLSSVNAVGDRHFCYDQVGDGHFCFEKEKRCEGAQKHDEIAETHLAMMTEKIDVVSVVTNGVLGFW